MGTEGPLRAAYERHFEGLFRVALLMTGSRQEAEDIVQDSFIKATPRLVTLSDDEVGPYLRATVINEWRSRSRRFVRLRARLPFLIDPEQAPAMTYEDRDEVWASVLRLPPRQRACVVLRFYEDLPLREIADVLDCSVGTVKSQLHHALARIRKDRADVDRG